MNADDLIARLRGQLIEQFQLEATSANRIEVYTPFVYDDGDPYTFAVAADESTGQLRITDEGEVITHASYSGIDLLSDGRNERLLKVAAFYGVQENSGELWLPTQPEQLGQDLSTFTQACFEISRMAKLPAERSKAPSKKRKLREALTNIVETVAHQPSPPTKITRNWHHPEFDPHRIYRAEYCLEWAKQKCLLFCATSDSECWKKAASCLHYRQLKFPFAGIVVVDRSKLASDQGTTALEDADAKVFDASDKEEIREHLLAIAG